MAVAQADKAAKVVKEVITVIAFRLGPVVIQMENPERVAKVDRVVLAALVAKFFHKIFMSQV